MARYHHSEPKPVGTIIGVIACLGAIGGFLILVSTGVIKLGSDKPKPRVQPPPVSGGPSVPGPVTNPPPSTGTPTQTPAPPATPGIVRVEFSGSFTAQGDTRKIVYKCPHCNSPIVDVLIAKCPSCGKGLKWPQKVACGFCGGSGKCKFCKGTGKCPACAKGPRMLMGVKPPCDVCNSTGKCPACNGNGTCTFCESGVFYPGKPSSSTKTKAEEPAPIPKPKPE
jgi:hypothetical protein